jgi:hypothetical protein
VQGDIFACAPRKFIRSLRFWFLRPPCPSWHWPRSRKKEEVGGDPPPPPVEPAWGGELLTCIWLQRGTAAEGGGGVWIWICSWPSCPTALLPHCPPRACRVPCCVFVVCRGVPRASDGYPQGLSLFREQPRALPGSRMISAGRITCVAAPLP